MRKQGLSNQCTSFLGVIDNRKVTSGIIELSPARVHIDLVACYFDVVSSYPGSAAGPKGGVVRQLKGSGGLVWTVVRQVGCFVAEARKIPDGKGLLVREERSLGATSLPVVC